MRKRQVAPAFPEYLREMLRVKGYATPTDFARTAGIHPSVVLRWVNGETRPRPELLERIAPYLDVPFMYLLRVAYPETDQGGPLVDDTGRQIHPLAAQTDRLLGANSPLTDLERDTLVRVLDSVLSPYRNIARRAVS